MEKEKAIEWKRKQIKISKLANERMWDDSTEFYYSVNRKIHSFKFDEEMAPRGNYWFLALWAEAAPKTGRKIIKHLTI